MNINHIGKLVSFQVYKNNIKVPNSAVPKPKHTKFLHNLQRILPVRY